MPGVTDPVRAGEEIVIAGRRFGAGVPVVVWSEPGGYDGYRETAFFARTPGAAAARYDGRPGLEPGATPESVARVVDQVVVHYDAVGTSRGCFRVLHDLRGLSCHFLIDLDGTVYQTLDVRERAWHATRANDRSVGVELANVGAFAPEDADALDAWYTPGPSGSGVVTLPASLGDGGVRTAGFVARPARSARFEGVINGHRLVAYDLTEEQYRSLIALVVTLRGALPGIEARVPRGPDGRVADGVLTDEQFASFRGVLGHQHVQANKVDPGPAFDWERVDREIRRGQGEHGGMEPPAAR